MGKHTALFLAATVLAATAQAAHSGAGRVMSLSFAGRNAWNVFAEEPWWALVDTRDMLSIFHPYLITQTAKAAGASRIATIPRTWEPPFALRFYCADDYFADPEKHKRGQVGTESFFGHRFKQALIDGKVVWESDVIDDNVIGSRTVFQVDITPHVRPGEPFTLAFRAFDKVSTAERNDRDVWFIRGTWYAPGDGAAEQEPRFHTSVWFADPVIGERAAVQEFPAAARPNDLIAQSRHRARWPIPPPGECPRLPVRLELISPCAIPAGGFPITCGVPVPPGLLTDASAVRLRERSGRDLALQAKATGWWPDGSIRWLLLNAVAPGSCAPGARFWLHLDKGTSPPPRAPVKVTRRGRTVIVNTGALRLELAGKPGCLIDAAYCAGGGEPLLAGLEPRMAVLSAGRPAPVRATVRQARVIENGPVRGCVELTGSLDTAVEHIGRFVFRIYAYAGLETVQTNFRVLNDVKPEPHRGTVDDPALEITDLALVAHVPGGTSGNTAAGVAGAPALVSDSGGISLLQDRPDHFAVANASKMMTEGVHAQGWIRAQGDAACVQASVWRFWQQYPKALKASADALEISLFAPAGDIPAYRPRFGEAKRHDIWFTFSKDPPSLETSAALGLLADEPPRLFSRDWFCRSGGVNVLDPGWFENHPQLQQWVAKTYGDISTARVTGHLGLRDFGDMPYGSKGQWFNGYWAMVQGALNWGLASGDQRWIERSFEISRHIADVDSVNIPPGHPDWKEWDGLTCALGTDHSVHDGLAKWPAFQMGESLILHYWMTGDPDSLQAARANADNIVRNRAGVGSVEARSQARPMLTLLRAWQATRNDGYRRAAARYLDLNYQAKHVIEWRRGAYVMPLYENWRCISAGLDSMYAQNIYEYYRLTGDPDAARLVVAIADSVYAESMLPQEEGLGSFLFYVRYSRGSWYYTQMAILFHMAFDLTGDAGFLRAGRAAFARYLVCADASGNPMYQPYNNFGWLDPEFGGWEQGFKRIATQPFTITGQTPDPDPARYER